MVEVAKRTSRRGMLRSGAIAVAAGASGGLAAACGATGGGGSQAAKPATGQPVKVTFFSLAGDPQGDEIMRDQTNKFNAASKSIQIDYVFTAPDDNYKNYTTAMVS